MDTHGIYGQVLLETHPSARGFLSRYLLCLTPIALAGLIRSCPHLPDDHAY